jgi:uncharacterized repeat protein (TIGR02543 family)
LNEKSKFLKEDKNVFKNIKIFILLCFILCSLIILAGCEESTHNDEFQITFDTQGGQLIDTIEEKALSLIDLPVPKREGYNFVGWVETDSDMILPASLRLTKDFHLLALWEGKLYSVIYETNGGIPIEEDFFAYESSIELKTPRKQGYTFIGWYIDETLETPFNIITMPMEHLTVFAKWTINTYQIIFISNGGTFIDDIEAEYQTPIYEPNEPTRMQYEFGGWYSDVQLTEPFEFNNMPASNIALYAKWIPLYDMEPLTVGSTNIFYYQSSERVMIPTNYEEQDTEIRGMWVATVFNLNMPLHTSETQYKNAYNQVIQKIKDANMNAIFFQVRPMNDAFYDSNLAPYSRYLTGLEGFAPGWDVMQYMIETAHLNGIEFHAWLNPYRVANSDEDKASMLSSLHVDNFARKNPHLVVAGHYTGSVYPYILNPGEPDVKNYIEDVVLEIVENYDVDGIHFDDYFYPYSGMSDDLTTYNQYKLPNQSIEDFRRENVNTVVRNIKQSIDEFNELHQKEIRFGISPFGIWASRFVMPDGSNTAAGNMSSYERQYADSKRWVEEGWVHYIAPQIYWRFSHSTAPYADLVDWWANVTRGTGVDLLIGQAIYSASIGSWPTEEIGLQIKYNQKHPEIKGVIMYSYAYIENSHMQHVNTFYWTRKPTNTWGSFIN